MPGCLRMSPSGPRWTCSHDTAAIIRPPMKPQRAQLAEVLASLANPSLRYADIRWTETSEQHVRVRNGEVENLASTVDRAIGVRVLVGNGWGFAASNDTSEAALRATALRALDV